MALLWDICQPIISVVSLGITILVAHYLCGIFGVALGALGMLGTLDNGTDHRCPSAPSRTTRAASLRCRNLMSGSENVPTYTAPAAPPPQVMSIAPALAVVLPTVTAQKPQVTMAATVYQEGTVTYTAPRSRDDRDHHGARNASDDCGSNPPLQQCTPHQHLSWSTLRQHQQWMLHLSRHQLLASVLSLWSPLSSGNDAMLLARGMITQR